MEQVKELIAAIRGLRGPGPVYKQPWWERRFGTIEFNPGVDETCTVNVGANQEVTIDKMYGPLVGNAVRVRLEYKGEISDWVIESEKIERTERDDGGFDDDIKWVERARWNCQDGLPDDD